MTSEAARSDEEPLPAAEAGQFAPARQAERQYLHVGKNLVELDGVQLGIAKNVQGAASRSYAGQLLLETVRREYQYARLGLGLGLATVLSGTFLCLHGAVGSTSWTAKALGVFESTLSDATSGSIIFVVGLFVIVFTRPRVRMKNMR